ncbi:alpha-L-rhamnosidase [Colletotrichum asianum]
MMFLSTSALLSMPLLASPVLAGHAGQVSEPSTYQRARFRWWWPGGWIEPDQVSAEITSIADAGFGGGEIGDVRDSVKGAMDPAVYGWGEQRWNNDSAFMLT